MIEQTDGVAVETGGSARVDPLKAQIFMQGIRDEQNLMQGCIGGIVAAAAGAGLWGVVTAVSDYQIGLMAVGVGLLVGYVVRFLGKGIDRVFGIAGGALSLAGCLAGNLLAVCIAVSRQEHMALMEVISRLNPDVVFRIMKATFNPMDLLFYGIAVYEGYRFSFRRLTPEELAKLAQ